MTTLVEISAEVARHALEVRHRCNASLHHTSPIQLMGGPSSSIEGTVHVFALADYPGAAEASVWAAWALDGAAITIHIVLHTDGIVTAVDAVRSIYTT